MLRTVDAGKTWSVFKVPGAEKLDFRDVEGFSADEAVILSIGPGEDSRVYRTSDGGHTWIPRPRRTRNPKRLLRLLRISMARKGACSAIRWTGDSRCYRIPATPGRTLDLVARGTRRDRRTKRLSPRAAPASCGAGDFTVDRVGRYRCARVLVFSRIALTGKPDVGAASRCRLDAPASSAGYFSVASARARPSSRWAATSRAIRGTRHEARDSASVRSQ